MARYQFKEGFITHVNRTINSYISHELGDILESNGLKFNYASPKEIKIGKFYEDRIVQPKEGFFNKLAGNTILIADMKRSIYKPSLEIRVLNSEFKEKIQKVVEEAKEYTTVNVSMK